MRNYLTNNLEIQAGVMQMPKFSAYQAKKQRQNSDNNRDDKKEALNNLMQLYKYSTELDKFEQSKLEENIRFLPAPILQKLYEAGSFAFVKQQQAGVINYD